MSLDDCTSRGHITLICSRGHRIQMSTVWLRLQKTVPTCYHYIAEQDTICGVGIWGINHSGHPIRYVTDTDMQFMHWQRWANCSIMHGPQNLQPREPMKPNDLIEYYTGDTNEVNTKEPEYSVYEATAWNPKTGDVLFSSHVVTALDDGEAYNLALAHALDNRPEGMATVDVIRTYKLAVLETAHP